MQKRRRKREEKKKKKGNEDDLVAKLPKEIMPPESITVFYASNTTQVAYEHPDYKSSMFTYFLLRGLKRRG